jgi:hypothetical protein
MSSRRLLLFTSALAAALVLGLGCHTSPRAAAHAFSSDAAQARPLGDRLRDGPEHDAALERSGRPYVLKADPAAEGALLYYGARHVRDRSDPQQADITARWKGFAPTVALCEGRQPRHWYGFLVEPFAGLPEPTLVHKLAGADDVRLVSLEPEYAEEVAALLDRFEPEQVALFFFLRIYISEAGGQRDEDLATDLLVERTAVDGLRGALPDLAAVDAAWADASGGSEDWRVLVQEHRSGWLAQVSDASRTARGTHMVRVLLDLLDQGERVFAVVGSGHVVRQEWALRDALGLEPAWDQPDDAPSDGG